jgi:hypothetical protein
MIRALVILSVFACSTAFAQTADRPEERRTIIDMDEDLIEGSLKTPDHVVFKGKVRTQFRSLIQIRKEFRREVLASAEQL